MSNPDILDEIIEQLDPSSIPTEFILLAKVRMIDGMEKIVTGEALEDYMMANADTVADVRVILDVKMIRDSILQVADEVLFQASQF